MSGYKDKEAFSECVVVCMCGHECMHILTMINDAPLLFSGLLAYLTIAYVNSVNLFLQYIYSFSSTHENKQRKEMKYGYYLEQ